MQPYAALSLFHSTPAREQHIAHKPAKRSRRLALRSKRI